MQNTQVSETMLKVTKTSLNDDDTMTYVSQAHRKFTNPALIGKGI